MVAFLHPSSAHGVLVELKQDLPSESHATGLANPPAGMLRYSVGDLELVSLCDGFFRLDGGAVFGAAPKPQWSIRTPADELNRVRLGMRPLLVRGEKTLLQRLD